MWFLIHAGINPVVVKQRGLSWDASYMQWNQQLWYSSESLSFIYAPWDYSYPVHTHFAGNSSRTNPMYIVTFRTILYIQLPVSTLANVLLSVRLFLVTGIPRIAHCITKFLHGSKYRWQETSILPNKKGYIIRDVYSMSNCGTNCILITYMAPRFIFMSSFMWCDSLLPYKVPFTWIYQIKFI